MIWTQIIYFVVTLALSIALAPKPRAPRAAALEDFEFPTAEEGRAVPVVFGQIDITGPNVVWYGDLDVQRIRKRSGFSKVTVGYKYYIGFHLGLCHGPVNSVTAVKWGDKDAWTGSITGNASGTINQPDLFGGENRGGGVQGDFDVAMGGDAQTANAYLTSALGETPPAYRGILSFIWKGGWIGNSEFIKPIAVRVNRTTAGWSGGTAWYSSRAAVGVHMNPAHIVYQVLTDPRWGMGVGVNRIDDAKFRAVADALWTEGFGLSLIWNQSVPIESFLQTVLDHIGGGVTFNLVTGLYELTLFRADYDVDDLDIYDTSNIVALDKFEKQAWGDTVNEVTISYTDPDTLQTTTITAQDLGNVDSQGSRLAAIVDLPGIRDHAIARVVLARELAQRTTPLTRITMRVNRQAWAIAFGGIFRLNYPARNCNGRVFRVLKVSRGTLQSNEVVIEAIEDIYQNELGVGIGVVTPPVGVPSIPSDDAAIETSGSVISATTTTPPTSPMDGDTYLVPAGATGDWAGEDGRLAEWDGNANEWIFFDIPNGEIIFVEDTATNLQNVNGTLTPLAGASSPLTTKGDLYTRNATVDARLPVGSPGRLLSANPATATGLEWIDPPASSPLAYEGDIYIHDGVDNARLPVGLDGQILRVNTTEVGYLEWADYPPVNVGGIGSLQKVAGAGWSGNGGEIELSGAREVTVYIHQPSTILSAVLIGGDVGSAVVDVRRTTLAGLPAAPGDSICSSSKPTLSGQRYDEDTTLAGWTTALNAGDVLTFVLQSVSGLEQLSLYLVMRVEGGVSGRRTVGASFIGDPLATPTNEVTIYFERAAYINSATIFADGVGNAVVDVRKVALASLPAAGGDSICASAKPTLSAQRSNRDTTLSGWDRDIAAGDTLTFVLQSVSSVDAVTAQLDVIEYI